MIDTQVPDNYYLVISGNSNQYFFRNVLYSQKYIEHIQKYQKLGSDTL